LSPEETAWVLLQCLGERLRGQRFVYDLKFSDHIPEAARRLGAEPLVERSGHAFLHARMREADALLGADVGGHYFHRALDGGDDALYTTCLLLAYLARTGQTLAALRRACPAIYITPDLRVPTPPDRQPEILSRVSAAWAQFPQLSTDGVRIEMPGGWALVRRSMTEPALTFRFEGLDWHALEDLVARFREALPADTSESLWRQYRTAMGLEGE
jgi:phosphomannomutase/phosphoglucomutase